MMQPLFDTFRQDVAMTVPHGESSRDELHQSMREWARNNCQLVTMRPIASNLLVYLATNTSMMMDPSSLREHVIEQLKKP
jgi:hypothetical protein